MAGVPIGGIIAALIGLAVIPAHGWRPMFAIGAAVSVLIFVLTLFLLPESAAFRQAQHTAQNAATAAKAGLRNLFESRWALLSMLFAAATFMNLLTWYGLNTWLTTLMRHLQYPLSSALQFSLTLNMGAIAGSFLLAWAADRWGTAKLALTGSLIVAAALVGVPIGTGNSVFCSA
jgi:AAHS family benzoate transporter-like MFS transporter